MRTFKTWRDPYGEGWSTCRPRQIEMHPGLTVLVGCNGAGKTTLLQNIQSELKKEKIPVCMFDNLHDGGSYGMSSAAFNENYGLLANMWTSSEGENISNNIGVWITGIRNFIINGKYSSGRKLENWDEIFLDEEGIKRKREEKKLLKEFNERWLLLDAADSGLSIDNVIEYKELFQMIIDDANSFDKEVYIIISANEYELARGEQCFDVNVGKYLTFTDYDDYRKFIIKSRKKKDKRYEK